MNANDAIAIRFNDGSTVELSKVFEVADAYAGPGGYLSPEYVIWSDGFESFAKGWWMHGKLCEVGAGAYGAMRIIERTIPDSDPAAVAAARPCS